MYINVFYDSPNDCDLIDLSLPNFESVITLQDNFLKWLYDKNNDHEYWIYRNNQKFGCAYDSTAFVNWINKYYSNYAAQLIEKHIRINDDYPTIYF